MIRWLVVDTVDWLSGRKVLLPPSVLGHPEPDGKIFPVRLTKAEVEASSPYDPSKPVDRAHEDRMAAHYAKPRPEADPVRAAKPQKAG